MTNNYEDDRIISSPSRYEQWLNCFEKIKSRMIDYEEYALLCSGKCDDSEQSLEYYQRQLINAVNSMINRCISLFNKEIWVYTTFNEIENLHIPYARFAGRIKLCMFYRDLDFLGEKFKKELSESIEAEVSRFWNLARRTLYNSCIDSRNILLEDEMYLINRIKLF